MSGLRLDQLEVGKCYRTLMLTGHGVGSPVIRLAGAGEFFVTYYAWDHDISDWRNPNEWHRRRTHRVIFELYDGSWHEVEDPSA